MSLALYRKYRPRSFAEIIGQEHVTEPLSQALRTGRLHHAYLFSGPRGCGKTSSARILARSLNCEKGPTPTPCGECDSCRALAPDGPGSIDVIEIDAASHGGVDDARDLRERAFFAPVSSRFKVYVIDEAHMVSSAGFNALLKLVEEPPDYVKFVFATTEPEKVLGTIKSRTHHYPFRLIPPGVLRPYLEQLCATEGVAVQPTVFPLVVRAGGGSARDALSVLDQLIAGAGPEGVTYARAVALLGVTDSALLDEVCDALAAGDGAAAYATIDRVIEAGHDPRRFAGDLLERLRDLIITQQVPDAIGKGLLSGPDDELTRLSAQAERFGSATLSRMADIVHTGLTDMRGTTAPRLVLELIVARMLLPGAEDSTGALLQRLERMERRLALAAGEPVAGASPAPQPEARPRPASGPAPISSAAVTIGPKQTPDMGTASATVPDPGATGGARGQRPEPAGAPDRPDTGSAPRSGAATNSAPPDDAAAATPPAPSGVAPLRGATPDTTIDAAAVRRIWDEVLTMVRRRSPRAAAVVREATVREVDRDVLVLVFRHAFHAETLSANPELLVEALFEVLGVRWRITCEVSGQAAGAPPAVPASAPTSTRGTARVARSSAPPPEDPEPEEDWPTPAPLGGPDAAGAPAPAGDPTSPPPPADPAGADNAGQAGDPPPGNADHRADRATPDRSGHPGDPARSDPPGGGRAHRPAGGSPASDAPDPRPTQTAPDPGPAPGRTGTGATSARAAGGRDATRTTPVTPSDNGAGSARRAPGPRAAQQATGSGRPSTQGGSGRAAARAAASRAASGAGRRPAGTTRDDVWAGGADEPPYDPEYDGPVRASTVLGFDPGDEPLDDVDDETAKQTSEEQALTLLRQTLGAEKIEEIDNR